MWLEGDLFVRRLTVFESSAIGFDEFNIIGDDLKAAAILAIICDPFVLIEIPGQTGRAARGCGGNAPVADAAAECPGKQRAPTLQENHGGIAGKEVAQRS